MTKLNLLLLITLSSLAFQSNAFDLRRGIGGDTGGPKQSWQDIRDNPDLKPAFPPVVIEDQMINYNFLCLHDGIVRSQYKVKLTDKATGDTYFKYLYEDRTSDDVISGQCHLEEIPRKLPIYIYARTEDNSKYKNVPREVLFIKTFSLKECRKD
jgi:hypothetical protein